MFYVPDYSLNIPGASFVHKDRSTGKLSGMILYNPTEIKSENITTGQVIAHEVAESFSQHKEMTGGGAATGPRRTTPIARGGVVRLESSDHVPIIQQEGKYIEANREWLTNGVKVQDRIAQSMGLGKPSYPSPGDGNETIRSMIMNQAMINQERKQAISDMKQDPYQVETLDKLNSQMSENIRLQQELLRSSGRDNPQMAEAIRQQQGLLNAATQEREKISNGSYQKDRFSQSSFVLYESKAPKDLVIDTSKIDETHLNDNAVLAVANTASTQAANMALPGVGLATRLVGTGMQFHDISNVATGQADPHVIEGVVPSAVMGWDIIKGNKNLPTQTSITPINTNYNDGALQQQIQGVKMIRQNFSTDEPGVIGDYGFGSGDKTTTSTSQQSVAQTTFSGSNFNENYRNK